MRLFTKYNLTPTEACVFAVIIDRASPDNNLPVCIATIRQKYIADLLGVSLRTITSAIKTLESKGLIDKPNLFEESRKNYDGQTRQYFISKENMP